MNPNEQLTALNDGEADAPDEEAARIFDAYLVDLEAGRSVDPEALIAAHPHLADRLRACLAVHRWTDRLADLSAIGPGFALPDFEIVREIGRGGMGAVFEARQVSLNRPVALKMLLGGALASEVERRRFAAEAEAVASLDHPNIVPIYEVSEHEGRPFFTMRLIEGGSLAERLEAEPEVGDPRTVAGLVAIIARAVHHAHQRGVLHRDLKPSNILRDAEGRPQVVDFGLARRIAAEGDLTRTGAALGTPAYMAPEQAEGRGKAISTATDVYGLGAILYALLAGRPPFRGDSVLATLEQVKHQTPQPPSRSGAPPDRDLGTICLKCLEKNPARRYESALALAEDLERWMEGRPIRARPVRGTEHVWRWCRRNPVVASLLGLIVVLLVGGLGLGSVLIYKATEAAFRHRRHAYDKMAKAFAQRDEAKRTLYLAEMQLAQELLRTGSQERAGHFLDSYRSLPQEAADPRDWEWYYLAGVLFLRRLGGPDGAVRQSFKMREPVLTLEPCERGFQVPGPLVAVAGAKGIVVRSIGGRSVYVLAPSRDRPELTVWSSNFMREFPGGGSSTGFHFLATTAGGEVTIWAPWEASVADQAALTIHADATRVSALAWGNGLLATAGGDGVVSVWEVLPGADGSKIGRIRPGGKLSGRLLYRLQGTHAVVRRLGWANEQVRLYAIDSDGVLIAWDASSREERSRFTTGQFLGWDTARDRLLATDSTSGAVAVWELTSGRTVSRLPRAAHAIRSAAWNREGTRLASLDSDGTFRVWDAATWRELVVEPTPVSGPATVWWDGGGPVLVGEDGTIRWWNAEPGHHLPGDLGPNAGPAERLKAANAYVSLSGDVLGEGWSYGADRPDDTHIDPKSVRVAAELTRRAIGLLEPAGEDRSVRSSLWSTLDRLGWLLRANGVDAEAEQAFRRALAICEGEAAGPSTTFLKQDDELRVRLDLGDLLAFSERPREAEEIFRQVAETKRLKSKDATSFGLLIFPSLINDEAWRLVTASGAPHQAAEWAVTLSGCAVEISPATGAFWNTRGVAFYRAGQWRPAIANLEHSMKLRAGGDPDDWLFLAMAYWRLGQPEEARRWYEKSVRWMELHPQVTDETERFRAEAAGVLGL